MTHTEFIRLRRLQDSLRLSFQHQSRSYPSRRGSKSQKNATGQNGLKGFKVIPQAGLETQVGNRFEMPRRTR